MNLYHRSFDAALVRDLSGDWFFRIDPDDVGVDREWWKFHLADRIMLPGSVQAQGYGDDISFETSWVGHHDRKWYKNPYFAPYQRPDDIKFPFWLQPAKHYQGPAWYQRSIEIPEAWRGKRIVLTLERVHWESRVWIDDVYVGRCDSLSTPHMYDLTDWASPGRHTLTLRIDNRMVVDVGRDAHSVTDHTQTNWNGAVGAISLSATDMAWIEDVQVYPNVEEKTARVIVSVENRAPSGGKGRLRLWASAEGHLLPPQSVDVDISPGPTTVETTIALGPGALLWDEFHPNLYRLTVELTVDIGSANYVDLRDMPFGLREFGVDGTQFTINGAKTFLRGTLECAVFPLTGYPPTDVSSWRRIYRTVKAHGLNHVRFHSWCPPEAAFTAADECGVYLQVECGAWGYVGEGRPLDQWLYDEARRILKWYGNHPSFVLMTHGNEPHGDHVAFLREWVSHWRKADPRRLHTAGSAWPHVPENQFHIDHTPRLQGWGEELKSRINATPPNTLPDYREWVERSEVPIISHEIGQWCAYPNFDEIAKYTGVLKAKNFELFQSSLRDRHMGDQAHDFLMASGALQTLCYKEEIEAALRTPGFGGFQLLGLSDFPGQGTALVGVLDAFWESKGYVAPHEFRRFCGPTVLLARLSKRTQTRSETLEADIEIAHFGPNPIEDAVLAWRLLDERGKCLVMGRLDPVAVPIGNGTRLGRIDIPMSDVPAPHKLRLHVWLETHPTENHWDIWVYPDVVDLSVPDHVVLCERLDADALAHLSLGGTVIVLARPEELNVGPRFGFSSMFWNTVWTQGQAPHTLGLVCDPRHPAFTYFPTGYHTDWQWWDVIYGSEAMVVDHFPPQLRPIVQPIDTWVRNHRLALLFEARIGPGKVLVSSMNLHTDLDRRPAARQMFHSLCRYAGSEAFSPDIALDIEEVQTLWKDEVPDAADTVQPQD